jgi:1,4-alpha-glucan branching enzyme
MNRKNKVKGYWIPVLHSHLPFVKHPEHDYFLEEHWLFEAVTESYIPLLMKMKELVSENIDFRLTISLAPPLLEMLSDEHLTGKYDKYLDNLITLSESESGRLKRDRKFLPVADFYRKRLKNIKLFFEGFLKRNVLNGYRYFDDLGKLELITSCATHGFLPLLKENSGAIRAQISVAIASFQKHFGRTAEGIWLPECAYYEGLDEVLKNHNLNYFFLDSRGIMEGTPAPRYSVYAPVYTSSGIAVFGRDPLSSKQVWSGVEGYPGDSLYRDFYRDVGFDLDYDYIKPFISPDGERVFTGMKYYRITGDTEAKDTYIPLEALKKTADHASHFYSERVKQAETLGPLMDRPPASISPYDAELFGHWWFEGPDFMSNVFREMSCKGEIRAITPTEYLNMHPQNQVISPGPTSWGYQGYYDVWLNSDNDWIYRHLHFMADKLQELANKHTDEEDTLKVRILNQLTRELLLAQSSDWAFLMTANTAREYSSRRTKEHINNFNTLLDTFLSGTIDVSILEPIENKNSIFEELDFRVFADK